MHPDYCRTMLKSYQSQSALTKAHIQMHLSILLWGATGVLGKWIQLSEGMLVWYRLIIATVSLGVYLLFLKKSFRISRHNFLQLFGVGTILMIHWLLFYGAIKYSNVSVTLSLFASTTLFTALMEPLVSSKRFSMAELVFSLIAMLGIAIIFYADENDYSKGIVLALMAAFVGAFFNIFNKNIVKEVATEVVSFYEIFSGLIVLTLFLPLYIKWLKPEVLIPGTTDVLLLLVLAIFCTHITLILSLNALKHLSPFTLNLAINLEPVYGIALAFIFLGENKHLNEGFFIGTVLILLSVLLHYRYSVRVGEKPSSLNTGNL